MNLPNLFTLCRILVVPIFVWCLIVEWTLTAVALFLLAGVTDMLDGFLARTYHQRTRLGAFLDPAADKLLLVSSFVTLGVTGDVPLWFPIVIGVREVLMVAATSIVALLVTTPEIKPSLVGKAATFFQLITVFMVLLAKEPLVTWISRSLETLFHPLFGRDVRLLFFAMKQQLLWGTAFFTALSGLHYLFFGGRDYAAKRTSV